MKLDGLALCAILLGTISNACANGSGDAPGGGEVGSGGTPREGPGQPMGDEAGVDDSGFPDAAVTADSGNPFGQEDGSADAIVGDAGRTSSVDSAAKDAGPDPACGMQTTQSACAQCCATANPAAVNTLNTAITSCACGASGPCATPCASEVCAGIPATSGDACYACLSSALGASGSCYTPVQTACVADPACASYLSCESAECSGLP
jgi:hypothetical protein